MELGVTAFSPENIRKDNAFPLLQPLSAIAGRRAVTMGQYFLEKQYGGSGILLPGIPEAEISAGQVAIFGGGAAAENAADIAVSMGCPVTILELNDKRSEQLQKLYAGKNVTILKSTTEALAENIRKADLFISTILIPGAKPPKLVKEYMVKSMKKGSVIVDIAIDQGETVETIDCVTTHEAPVFVKHDVVHYAVPNIPGAVPQTATLAMSKGNIEYLKQIADKELEKALLSSAPLVSGVSVYKGKIVSQPLADSIELPYITVEAEDFK